MKSNHSKTHVATAVVINDDVTQLQVLTGLLRKEGLNFLAFESAESALLAMDRACPPDLIITDLYMPGIDGWRFCRLLRSPEYEPFNQVPILVVSATFSGEEASNITADLGANAFLPSPVDGKQFTEQVRALLGGEKPRNHLRALIIEDSRTLAGLLKKAFKASDYLADIALTAGEAAQAFQQAAYDVAVLDYHLPDGIGDELLAGFRKNQPDCICIMMTTDPSPELALAWMRQGAAAYLRKPFEPAYLIEICVRARRERALLRVQDLLEVRTRELRESEEQFATFMSNLPAAAFIKDEAGRTLFANQYLQELLNFQNWEGKTTDELVAGEVGKQMAEDDRKVFAQGPLKFQETMTDRHGAPRTFETIKFPIRVEGKPMLIGGIAVDITDRKLMDEERTLLSSVVEQAEENVLITDDRRTIIYINPAFERSSGYRCEELKGQKLRTLRSDQHDEGFYHTTKKILDRGQVWMGVIINKGKNGTIFEIEGTISPIRNASGAINHFVAVGRNMSRFRRLEKELQQAQKLDALGTLAGGIAHDFNNVLSAIMGFIEIESLDAGEGSQTHHRMERALSACCRARDLIKQILAFSRQSDLQRRPIEMGPIIEDAIKMLRATLPTTIDIRFTPKAGQSIILGDSTQIHQIIVNLCTNSAHAMRDTGGFLEIVMDNVEIDAIEAAEHLDMQPGTYVRLVVGDTGHGMDQKTLERIFEPFFSTKGPGEGAGIGLAVVHGIVKSHGGRITAYSEPGKGSTFEVFFPRMETAVTPEEKPKAGLPTGTERILLVDDEEMLVAVITDMLKMLGYEVASANRSLDALQLFQSQCDRFHLVITDFTMPEMTGMELAAELLRIRGDIPIILSTGFTSSEIREKAMTMGIREVMMKPFILQELAETVRSILDGPPGCHHHFKDSLYKIKG